MMNKIARNLIKNSPIKRKWTALSNYTTTPSYVNPLAGNKLNFFVNNFISFLMLCILQIHCHTK